MERKRSLEAVLAACRTSGGKKRITCAAALKTAARHGIPLRTLGRLCDRNGIKIKACQLGCFR